MTIASLEIEIKDMEAELLRSQGCLDAAIQEDQALEDVAGAILNNRTLTKSLTEREPAADSAERSFVTLKGVTNWKPSTIDEAELSFQYVGPCPTNITLSFQISSQSSVKCIATVLPKLFHKHGSRGAKQHAQVSSFLQTRAAALCAAVCHEQMHTPHEIGPLMRRFEWQLGRLERTSAEVATLKRRYQAMLTPSQLPDSSNYQLEIDFSGPSGPSKLRATFEISEEYPFSPLNICLDTFDEQVDVEAIHKLLVKNAKSGFGYLSRTCDVIAAFLH
jgi:hypothetical protein